MNTGTHGRLVHVSPRIARKSVYFEVQQLIAGRDEGFAPSSGDVSSTLHSPLIDVSVFDRTACPATPVVALINRGCGPSNGRRDTDYMRQNAGKATDIAAR
jgi:hypothetical protein